MRQSCRGPHKFTVYGQPGLKSPTCVRCQQPRPKPLTASELADYLYWREHRGDN